jgi:hypothetical protein
MHGAVGLLATTDAEADHRQLTDGFAGRKDLAFHGSMICMEERLNYTEDLY